MFNNVTSGRNPLLVPELFHCILDCLAVSNLDTSRVLEAVSLTDIASSQPPLGHLHSYC